MEPCKRGCLGPLSLRTARDEHTQPAPACMQAHWRLQARALAPRAPTPPPPPPPRTSVRPSTPGLSWSSNARNVASSCTSSGSCSARIGPPPPAPRMPSTLISSARLPHSACPVGVVGVACTVHAVVALTNRAMHAQRRAHVSKGIARSRRGALRAPAGRRRPWPRRCWPAQGW